MNKKLSILLFCTILLAIPSVMLADFDAGSTPTPDTALTINGVIGIVLDFIWPFFVGFAVIMFIIAGFMFLAAQGDPAKAGEARMFVVWGVVGVIVAILAFSLPFVIENALP